MWGKIGYNNMIDLKNLRKSHWPELIFFCISRSAPMQLWVESTNGRPCRSYTVVPSRKSRSIVQATSNATKWGWFPRSLRPNWTNYVGVERLRYPQSGQDWAESLEEGHLSKIIEYQHHSPNQKPRMIKFMRWKFITFDSPPPIPISQLFSVRHSSIVCSSSL